MVTQVVSQTILARVAPGLPLLFQWRGVPLAPVFLLAAVVLTACGGADAAPGGANSDQATEQPAATEFAPVDRTDDDGESEGDVAEACADYMLAVGNVTLLEAAWPPALAEMQRGAAAWQPDARLVELTVGCDWGVSADCVDVSDDGEVSVGDDCGIESDGGLAWDGVFYTPDDYYWHSADGSTYMVMTEAPLDPAAISFDALRDALAAAGYDEATALPGGVTVTFDADSDGEPEPHFSYVLDLEPTADGELVRLVVDGVDGTVVEQTG